MALVGIVRVRMDDVKCRVYVEKSVVERFVHVAREAIGDDDYDVNSAPGSRRKTALWLFPDVCSPSRGLCCCGEGSVDAEACHQCSEKRLRVSESVAVLTAIYALLARLHAEQLNVHVGFEPTKVRCTSTLSGPTSSLRLLGAASSRQSAVSEQVQRSLKTLNTEWIYEECGDEPLVDWFDYDAASTRHIQDKKYASVLVGGTFDHMHAGHRLLLATSALLCTSKLVIGVSGAALLSKKKYAEQMQSFEERKCFVMQFLYNFGFSTDEDGHEDQGYGAVRRLEFIELLAPEGTLYTDPDVGVLVASKETETGALEVLARRQTLGFPFTALVLVDVLYAGSTDSAPEKLSSSALRQAEAQARERKEKIVDR